MNPYVLAHLAAIVAANLSVAHFGPSAIIINSFLFIGLDLTTRDKLHDAWHGRRLWPRMTALIAAGSILSWIVNRDAGQIALASFVAFAAAGIADTGAYVLLSRRPWWQRVNGSNVVAAVADSVIFPTLAFGSLIWLIIAGQFAAKVAGGAMWSVVLRRRASPALESAAATAAAAVKGGE